MTEPIYRVVACVILFLSARALAASPEPEPGELFTDILVEQY